MVALVFGDSDSGDCDSSWIRWLYGWVVGARVAIVSGGGYLARAAWRARLGLEA